MKMLLILMLCAIVSACGATPVVAPTKVNYAQRTCFEADCPPYPHNAQYGGGESGGIQ